ncbi:hypothetical protein [Sphaerisporangium aureirubrum]|uniref:Uncharacterized protein n=1 Tax=Sphaerisporangium aureirubrum TaxID=1544736 RepID=A0ABW1NQD6_9ACTN
MNPHDLIDSYVSDVTRLLPRRQRGDVALELRALLREELADRAVATRRTADEPMTHDLLHTFGRPAEVAARYRPPLNLIDPADSRRLLRLTVIGMAVIWLLGLLDIVTHRRITSPDDAVYALRDWWLGVAIQSLWWPGVLFVFFALAAWARRRRPDTARWKPRPVDNDRVSRTGRAAGLVFFLCGTVVLLAPDAFMDWAFAGRVPTTAFAYDDAFRHRAPWLLAFVIPSLSLQAILVVQGQWHTLTRRADIALNLAICAVLTWILLAGPVFATPLADQTAKGIVVLIMLVGLIDAGQRLRREWRRAAYATRLS